MGIDGMRVGGGRCPSLLVGGLLVACLMLICNWWTLSSENIELVRQIDELQEQLKISAEERDQCVTLRGNLEQRYKRIEDEVASLHVRLEQQKKKNDVLEESVTLCKSELDSLNKLDATKTASIEALRLQRDSINSDLDAQRDENKKLQDEIEKCKDEFEKLKRSYNAPIEKHSIRPQPHLTTKMTVKGQLDLVPENAVKVSIAGQRGLKYQGVPILPTDPPGAVRQAPRYSVTMLKAETPMKHDNDTVNDDAQEIPDDRDVKNAASDQEDAPLGDDAQHIADENQDKSALWPLISSNVHT